MSRKPFNPNPRSREGYEPGRGDDVLFHTELLAEEDDIDALTERIRKTNPALAALLSEGKRVDK